MRVHSVLSRSCTDCQLVLGQARARTCEASSLAACAKQRSGTQHRSQQTGFVKVTERRQAGEGLVQNDIAAGSGDSGSGSARYRSRVATMRVPGGDDMRLCGIAELLLHCSRSKTLHRSRNGAVRLGTLAARRESAECTGMSQEHVKASETTYTQTLCRMSTCFKQPGRCATGRRLPRQRSIAQVARASCND